MDKVQQIIALVQEIGGAGAEKLPQVIGRDLAIYWGTESLREFAAYLSHDTLNELSKAVALEVFNRREATDYPY